MTIQELVEDLFNYDLWPVLAYEKGDSFIIIYLEETRRFLTPGVRPRLYLENLGTIMKDLNSWINDNGCRSDNLLQEINSYKIVYKNEGFDTILDIIKNSSSSEELSRKICDLRMSLV